MGGLVGSGAGGEIGDGAGGGGVVKGRAFVLTDAGQGKSMQGS